MLSGAQLGITVTGLLAGYLAEPLIGSGLRRADRRAAFRARPVSRSARRCRCSSAPWCRCCSASWCRRISRSRCRSRSPADWRLSTHWYLRLFGWLIWFVRSVVERAVARAADRTGARRRTVGHRARSRAHRRQLPLRRPTAARAVHAARPDTGLPDQHGRARDDPSHTCRHGPARRVDRRRADPYGDRHTPATRWSARSTDDLLGVIDLHAVLDADPQAMVKTRSRPAVRVPASLPLPEVLAQSADRRRRNGVGDRRIRRLRRNRDGRGHRRGAVGEIADEHDASESEVVAGPGRLAAAR